MAGGTVEKRYDVFLAFGGVDREVVTDVRRRLEAIGWSAFCDAELPIGANWRRELPKAMAKSRAVVLLKPRHDGGSPYLDSEIAWATEEAAAKNCLFLPFRCLGAPRGREDEYESRHIVWASWRDDDAAETAAAIDAALRHPWHRDSFDTIPPEPASGPDAALLRAHLHLDRVHQWTKLRDLCSQKRPGCFVIHGPPGQHLDGFVARVRGHLSDDVDAHEVIVVSTDGLFHGDVSVEGWQGRVIAALKCEDPVLELRRRSRQRSVFLVIGSLAVKPARFTAANTRSWEAFATWASDHLPELVAAAQSKPLRVLVAVEEQDGGPWASRLEAAFATCLESLGHSHAKIKRVEFPPFDNVQDYIDLLGLRPTRPWWEQLEAVYGAIAAGSRDYRELADEIESLVEQLTKRGT